MLQASYSDDHNHNRKTPGFSLMELEGCRRRARQQSRCHPDMSHIEKLKVAMQGAG